MSFENNINTNTNINTDIDIMNFDKNKIILTINNKNRKANALYILATFKNGQIQVTIDTGANINCIRPDLIDLKLLDIIQNYKLLGPDNTSLKLLGTTIIELKIDNTTFQILVHVIENLNSTIILGNKFLDSNKAEINYTDRKLILNKNIETQLLNNELSQRIKSMNTIANILNKYINWNKT